MTVETAGSLPTYGVETDEAGTGIIPALQAIRALKTLRSQAGWPVDQRTGVQSTGIADIDAGCYGIESQRRMYVLAGRPTSHVFQCSPPSGSRMR
jgi:hypothetical protein